jgi:hypothetical protein
MKVFSSKKFSDSSSDNRKSKTCTAFDKLRPRACRGEPRRSIQNLKWAGILAIVLTFIFGGAVAQPQQPKKIPRIGYLSVSDPATESTRAEAFGWLCASLAT